MSGNTKTFSTDLYGEHEGRHPSMGDLKNSLTEGVKGALVKVIAERPGTAYVDYGGRSKTVTAHGKLYDDVSAEELTFGPDGSDTKPGHWRGWTTAHLKATFRFEDV
jgi:hypothetical protein